MGTMTNSWELMIFYLSKNALFCYDLTHRMVNDYNILKNEWNESMGLQFNDVPFICLLDSVPSCSSISILYYIKPYSLVYLLVCKLFLSSFVIRKQLPYFVCCWETKKSKQNEMHECKEMFCSKLFHACI